MKIKIAACIIGAMTFLQCQNNIDQDKKEYPYQEVRKKLYSNGNLEKEAEFLKLSDDSSIRNGYYKQYYEGGELKVLTFYKNDVQDSLGFAYFPNGNLQSRVFKFDGQFYGMQYHYYEHGGLKRADFSVDDKTRSFIVDFDPNGKITNITGRLIRITPPTEIIKSGEKTSVIGSVVVIDKYRTQLHLKITHEQKGVITDTTVDEFNYVPNMYFHYYVNNFNAPGKYLYDAKVSLIDSLTNKVVMRDTLQYELNVAK